MKELGILLLVAITAMGILLIILLRKITILKKQTDDIVKEVKAYVAYITEEVEEESTEQNIRLQKQAFPAGGKIQGIPSKEETQSHIIQAVLGEYFP
ncbi:MAG: hypothetical protein IJ419_09855 [Agathobacter sp.]|nr:hypothetical protein [Agathobacter sp.]